MKTKKNEKKILSDDKQELKETPKSHLFRKGALAALKYILVALVIYSAAFSICATVVLFKGASFVMNFYDNVVYLKDNAPESSMFMEALRDSNPQVNIKHRFVPLDSISVDLRKAVIVAEDPKFFYHPGFDLKAIANAFEANQAAGKIVLGGSTITQQLAKNMFLSGERTWKRKFQELAYALAMEYKLGKRRILELYLNYAQWGKNIFGCEAASQEYFEKSCLELNNEEAIVLAAMIASPNKHKPNSRGDEFLLKRQMRIRKALVQMPFWESERF